MSNFINNSTFERVDFGDAGGAGTLTVNNATDSVTQINLLVGLAADTAVFDRLVDSSSNSLVISSRGDLETTDVVAVTVNDEETLTISGSTSANDLHIATLNASDLTSLTVTGAADVLVDNAISGTRVATVDASTSTGAVEIHLTNNIVAATMTAGSGAAEFTGGILADTLTGGSGADSMIGGLGVDTINTGAGNDSVQGGAGGDIINVGTGTDVVQFDDSTSVVITALTNPISLTNASTDVITGIGNGDVLQLLAGVDYTATDADATATDDAFISTISTSALVNNGATLLRGDYIAGATTSTFISSATGADTLFVYDADEAAATTSYEAVVLVGLAGATGTDTEAGDVISIAISA
jgi:hypothetical protein